MSIKVSKHVKINDTYKIGTAYGTGHMLLIAIFHLWSTNWTRCKIYQSIFFQQIVVRPKGQKNTLGVMVICTLQPHFLMMLT